MNQQLPLRFRLENHTDLADYVGVAADRLCQLDGSVLLTGARGTGKSHLLQGLCHRSVADGESAIFLPMLTSLEPAILSGLESADLVCLDDVNVVLRDAAWQAALFHLVNACRDHATRLVMSSTVTCDAMGLELEDLKSRLKAAYQVQTAALTDPDKLEVIRLKARRRGFEMPAEVCDFILARADRDMHHLARLVDQLDHETLRQQKKVTIPFVKRALGL